MQPNTTPSPAIKVNQLILRAYKRAGVVPVEATLAGANIVPKLEHGRMTLDTILDSLQTEGIMARSTVLHELTVKAGEPYYELPDTVLDAFGDAMFILGGLEDIDPKRTNGELAVKNIDLAMWQALTNKEMESSRPQLYVVLRDKTNVRVRLWPTPSDDGVLRVRTLRLFGGSSIGDRPVDLARYWNDALIWCLAYHLATDHGLPTERCVYLAQVSEAKKAAAVRLGSESTPMQAMVIYPTQWSA